MQVNTINNSTSFKGIKLQTLNSSSKKIDIYSLDSRDGSFISKLSDLTQNISLPKDTFKIGNKTPRQILLNALHKASVSTKNDYTSKILLSVENDRTITGILNAEYEGDMTIKDLAVWTKRETVQGLLSTMINETQKLQNSALIIYADGIMEPVKKICTKMGFIKPKDEPSIYTIDYPDIKKAIKNIESFSNYKVKQYKNNNFISLDKKLIDINI